MSKNLVYMFKNTGELKHSRPLGIDDKLSEKLLKILDEIPVINYPVVYFEDYDRCILLGSEEYPNTYKKNPWVFIKGKVQGRIITIGLIGMDYIHIRISESPFDYNYAQEWHESGGYRIIKYDSEREKFKLYIPKEKPVGLVECFKTDIATWQYSIKLNS